MKRLMKAAVAAIGMTAMLTSNALAADWTPPGPIEMLIAFRAGGGADTQARLIAEELEARHGWKIIPKQVTGKGGINAAIELKGKPNDGTAIAMIVTETLGYNAAAAKGAGITPADFTGLATTAGFQMGVVAKTSAGFKTFADVVAAAKGGKDIRFGVMSPRLADLAYILGRENGVDFNIVSVKGGKAVMNGVNAGDMDVGFMAGIQAKGVAAGELVNLVSALSEPLKQTPEAGTIADYGVSYNSDGAGAMINKAFGGATVIKGDALKGLIQEGYDGAGALMSDAAN